MNDLHKVISYLHIWAGAITPQQWAVTGSVIGSMVATVGITAWIKRHHLKQTAEKLASQFIVLNVAFWGFLLSVTDFVITQGTTFGTLLPFIGTHWPQISGGAIATHAVATGVYKWWQDRKAGKPIVPAPALSVSDAPVTAASLQPLTSDIWKP